MCLGSSHADFYLLSFYYHQRVLSDRGALEFWETEILITLLSGACFFFFVAAPLSFVNACHLNTVQYSSTDLMPPEDPKHVDLIARGQIVEMRLQLLGGLKGRGVR